MRHSRRLAVLSLACALALASCVGIDADIRIGADGAVDLNLTYTVSNAADELGKLEANAAYLPFPVGRDELGLAATRAGGALSAWSRTDGVESFTVKASMRFPNPAALASFMDPAGELAVYAEAAGRKTLSLTLAMGTPPADQDFAAFVRSVFGSYAVSLRFRLPKAAVASSGLAVEGQTLSFTKPAAELYASQVPVTVSMSW